MSDEEPNAVSITWEKLENADSFEVQVSRTPGFTTLDYDKKRVLRSHFDLRDLEMNVPYHWRVRAVNDAGVGEWSSTRTFIATEEARLPSVPQLVSPAEAAKGQPVTIDFKWSPADHATSYHLEVSLDPLFNSIFASISEIPLSSQPVYGLVKSYTYYWRTRAYNPAGFSTWSRTRYLIIYGEEFQID
jgi:hypothetical protein